MKKYPCVLTIAGSDCSGGAGIQADIKSISALGAYAASAITAITVQNTCGVEAIHPIPPTFVAGQIKAVMTDIRPAAVKIGMVNDVEIIHTIAASLREYQPSFVVFDPVMVSTSGCRLIKDTAIEALTAELIPLATIITPNLSEAEVLAGHPVHTVEDMKATAKELLRFGSKSVLIKGGHLEGGEMVDVLHIAGQEEPHLFSAHLVDSKNTHGTGCSLSSSIATHLALGESIEKAVEKGKEFVFQGICAGNDVHIGEGHGPLNHFYSPVPMHIFTENE